MLIYLELELELLELLLSFSLGPESSMKGSAWLRGGAEKNGFLQVFGGAKKREEGENVHLVL